MPGIVLRTQDRQDDRSPCGFTAPETQFQGHRHGRVVVPTLLLIQFRHDVRSQGRHGGLRLPRIQGKVTILVIHFCFIIIIFTYRLLSSHGESLLLFFNLSLSST